MDIKYPIENEYMKCFLQINEFIGSRPRVRSSYRVESGWVRFDGATTINEENERNDGRSKTREG